MKEMMRKAMLLAALAGASALPMAAQTGSGGGYYLEPVYKAAGDPTSGIAYWTTNLIDEIDWEIKHEVTNSDAAVTWGKADETNWYVLSSWQPLTIKGGVTCKGDVRLILCGTSELTISGGNTAGIQTDPNGSFTIYGDSDGVAELVVTGGDAAAGIGGDGSDAKNITINGGVVTATGGECAAGIGGGYGGKGENITINGGTVKATGGDSADGIGSGSESPRGSNIIVADSLEVKADASIDPPTTVIAHTYTTDLAEDLQDKRYVTVKPAVPVARNVETDAKYTTVQAALNEATAGQTIALITNVTENIMITTAKTNTLDLAGCVLKGTDAGTDADTASVIAIDSADAAITIRDTSAGHSGAITTGGVTYKVNGAGINVLQGSLALYGVTITNCVTSGNGGAICGGKKYAGSGKGLSDQRQSCRRFRRRHLHGGRNGFNRKSPARDDGQACPDLDPDCGERSGRCWCRRLFQADGKG